MSEYVILKIPELTLIQKETVGQNSDIIVETAEGTFRTKSSTFLIDVINNLTTTNDNAALSATMGTTIKGLIDWQNEADGLIFDYDANWTLVNVGNDITTTIPAGRLRETDNTAVVNISGTSGTVVENGGIVLTKVSPTAYSYSFVSDLTTVEDGTDDVYIIAKNLDGKLYSRNPSLFKFILGDVVLADYIDFNPQNPVPSENEGRMYFNDLNKAYEAYTEITGVQPFRFGRVLRSRVLNNSGVTITRGKLCKIVGISGTSPIVELADNSLTEDIKLIVGMAMHDILDTEHGYLAVFDTVIGVDTSDMTVNDLIYADPDVLGGFTNTEPLPPFASYPIGFVSVVDATNGVVGIRVGGFSGSDTSINLKGVLNGIMTQTPQVDIVSNGTTITATVTNEEQPGENLPFLINDIRYLLPTGQSVTVPPGASSTEKQSSILYAYLNSGTPTLAIATSEPSIPYAKIADIIVFNASRTQTDGVFGYRRTNNAIDKKGDPQEGSIGFIRDIVAAIREKLGSNWLFGQDGTPTVNNTTIKLALSAGSARQFRKATPPSFDGNSYLIYNDTSNNVTYQNSTNLTDITADANGSTLLSNNTFYTIRIFYQLNSNGIGDNVIATRPLGSYTTSAEAIQDPSNYGVAVNDTDIEEIIYPLFDLVIGRTGAGGTTISLIQLTDRRSKLPSGIGGGGASGGGTDDKVRISANDTTNDYLNSKISSSDSSITKSITNPSGNEVLNLIVSHDNTSPSSAGTGVTYGHINAQAQDIYGVKEFTERVFFSFDGAESAHTESSSAICTTGQTGSYPFDARGRLILQPRAIDSTNGDFIVMAGAVATVKFVVGFDGKIYITTSPSSATITHPVLYRNSSTGAIEQYTQLNQASVASTSNLTPSGDARENENYITALAASLTINAPSGTPTNGNNLLIRIEDDGTTRALTWNAIYEAVGVTLPTTTVAGKKMYIGCIYNSADSKWDVVSVVQEA